MKKKWQKMYTINNNDILDLVFFCNIVMLFSRIFCDIFLAILSC